jgi:hypothetical protein
MRSQSSYRRTSPCAAEAQRWRGSGEARPARPAGRGARRPATQLQFRQTAPGLQRGSQATGELSGSHRAQTTGCRTCTNVAVTPSPPSVWQASRSTCSRRPEITTLAPCRPAYLPTQVGGLVDSQAFLPAQFRHDSRATSSPPGTRSLTQLPADLEADSAPSSRDQRHPAFQDVGLEGGLRGCHAPFDVFESASNRNTQMVASQRPKNIVAAAPCQVDSGCGTGGVPLSTLLWCTCKCCCGLKAARQPERGWSSQGQEPVMAPGVPRVSRQARSSLWVAVWVGRPFACLSRS